LAADILRDVANDALTRWRSGRTNPRSDGSSSTRLGRTRCGAVGRSASFPTASSSTTSSIRTRSGIGSRRSGCPTSPATSRSASTTSSCCSRRW